ncbi:MAG: PEP-CTERM sorting domain-containing protein [Thermodesulfobacteriota bacterium]
MRSAFISGTALLVVFLGTLLGTVPAGALPITMEITAVITNVEDNDGFLTGAIAVGDTIRGNYTYESEIPDTNILPDVGDYWHTTAPHGFALAVNGFWFGTDPGNVDFLYELCNNRILGSAGGWDAYVLHGYQSAFDIAVEVDPALADELPPTNLITLEAHDLSGTALSDTFLPLTAPDLSQWDWTRLTLTSETLFSPYGGYSYFIIDANVTSVIARSTTPIPEPGTLLLLGTGLAGIWGLGRRARIAAT